MAKNYRPKDYSKGLGCAKSSSVMRDCLTLSRDIETEQEMRKLYNKAGLKFAGKFREEVSEPVIVSRKVVML